MVIIRSITPFLSLFFLIDFFVIISYAYSSQQVRHEIVDTFIYLRNNYTVHEIQDHILSPEVVPNSKLACSTGLNYNSSWNKDKVEMTRGTFDSFFKLPMEGYYWLNISRSKAFHQSSLFRLDLVSTIKPEKWILSAEKEALNFRV